jgi:hypothetical protein
MTTEEPNTARNYRKGLLWSTIAVFRLSRKAVLVLALLASLALNVATLTVAPVFNALSSVIGSVAENIATVRGKHKQAVGALNSKLAAQSRRATSLARSNATLKRTVKQTTRRISGRIAKATARSTGSIAAESIPYVGIGVILGNWAIRASISSRESPPPSSIPTNQ